MSNYRKATSPLTFGYRLETGTAAELRLALTITLTLTDTGFTVLTILLGYRRRSPDPRTQEELSSGLSWKFTTRSVS